jgi:AraC-like DNA-binding protein
MAASLLLGTGHSISEIAEKCGFMSDSYFSKIFREIYKCTPREYRKAN